MNHAELELYQGLLAANSSHSAMSDGKVSHLEEGAQLLCALDQPLIGAKVRGHERGTAHVILRPQLTHSEV